MTAFRYSDVAATPRWFPHLLDTNYDRVLLVARRESDFHAASFLNDASLSADVARHVVVWSDVAAAISPDTRRDTDYIFHIGHVGSTLISRLLGEIGSVLAVREPLILRNAYEVWALRNRPENPWPPESMVARLDTITALLSRTFRSQQRTIVKATSFTSELAPQLLGTGARALLLYCTPERYIENILAGAASLQELHHLAGPRLARMAAHLGEVPQPLWDMNEGQKVAMAWACEMLALRAAADSVPADRILWCDFDRFLADPAARLVTIAAFFGHALTADAAQTICAGPILTRYSKAQEYAYSPGLRADVLAQSRAENRASIRTAMAWLDTMAARYPVIAAILQRTA